MATVKIDWQAVEEENKSQYKNYAPDGEYEAKLAGVEVVTASTGNTGLRFHLAETDEYKFPKYGHTFYNSSKASWRQYHMRECFIALGFTKEQAQKAVEQCEGAEDIMSAYRDMFEKALPKQKPFEIVVFKEYTDDQYSTWDFKYDGARMTYPKNVEKNARKAIVNETVPAEEAEQVDLSDMLPF